ncbi:MAG: hypothetical protein IT436_14990 [Phycisphaerales bacterium]|nr:hypothetical protein [Phycisphaerales bacterium]
MDPDRPTSSPHGRPAWRGLPAWMIGPLFLALAWWMLYWSPRADIPRLETAAVPRERFAAEARRRPMGSPPAAIMAGYSHPCNECHQLFQAPLEERRILMQHTHIALNHGLNKHCFNCHDRENRERLRLNDGTLLEFNEVPRLCSQCHGTVFRDWERGTHGKTMGSWDASSGLQHRLGCNDCHDPHAPAYPPIEPLPGPRTLRMGDQAEGAHAGHRRSPLGQWSQSGAAPPDMANPEGGHR